jgi:hypothetical protein
MSKKSGIRKLGEKSWAGVRYVWKHPVIVSGILLILAAFLFIQIIQKTFIHYTNCAYLLGTKLGMPAFFCDGYTVTWFGAEIFTIPGLAGVMNPPLEFIRKVISWSAVLFFGFLSVGLTMLINNVKAVIKILTFNKEEWRRLMASFRTWMLFFVVFCAVFYFTVVK